MENSSRITRFLDFLRFCFEVDPNGNGGWLTISEAQKDLNISQDAVVKLVIVNYERGRLEIQPQIVDEFQFRLDPKMISDEEYNDFMQELDEMPMPEPKEEPADNGVIEVECKCGKTFVCKENRPRKVCPECIDDWREMYTKRRGLGPNSNYGPL